MLTLQLGRLLSRTSNDRRLWLSIGSSRNPRPTAGAQNCAGAQCRHVRRRPDRWRYCPIERANRRCSRYVCRRRCLWHRPQVSTQDGRGSLNTDSPRYAIGNGFSAKAILTPKIDSDSGRKLSFGLAVDHTRDITDRNFALASALAVTPIGGVAAIGNRFTVEADAAYTFPLAGHPTTVEGELIRSRFSGSRSDVYGGYAMAQFLVFDQPKAGDLDVFVRYDLVSLGQDMIARRATQQALRTGFNYNLPYANKLASLHLEYGRTWVNGTAEIVTDNRVANEFRIGLRVSLQQYVRH